MPAGLSSRVLAIDEDRLMRLTYRHRLAELGYSVRTARSCREALDLLDREPFDLVMADTCLPDGDGSDVLRYARRIDPSVRVMLLTDTPEEIDEERALLDGVDAIVCKPCPLQDLAAETRRLLRRPPVAGKG